VAPVTHLTIKGPVGQRPVPTDLPREEAAQVRPRPNAEAPEVETPVADGPNTEPFVRLLKDQTAPSLPFPLRCAGVFNDRRIR
jgi:hypothetical protein